MSIAGGLRADGNTSSLGRTPLVRQADLDTLYFDNFAVFARAEQPSLLTPDAPLRLRLGETRASVGDVEGLERGDIVLVERVLVAREGARFAGRVVVPAGAGEGFLIEGRVAEPNVVEDESEGARNRSCPNRGPRSRQ